MWSGINRIGLAALCTTNLQFLVFFAQDFAYVWDASHNCREASQWGVPMVFLVAACRAGFSDAGSGLQTISSLNVRYPSSVQPLRYWRRRRSLPSGLLVTRPLAPSYSSFLPTR